MCSGAASCKFGRASKAILHLGQAHRKAPVCWLYISCPTAWLVQQGDESYAGGPCVSQGDHEMIGGGPCVDDVLNLQMHAR